MQTLKHNKNKEMDFLKKPKTFSSFPSNPIALFYTEKWLIITSAWSKISSFENKGHVHCYRCLSTYTYTLYLYRNISNSKRNSVANSLATTKSDVISTTLFKTPHQRCMKLWMMVHVLILACRRQREVGFCEFHAGQEYIVRSCFVLFSYEGVQLS